MVQLNSAPAHLYNIDGNNILLKDPTEFLKETFSLPDDQRLPYNWFEFTEIIVGGTIGSGKSEFVKNELCPIIQDCWSTFDKEGNLLTTEAEFIEVNDISKAIDTALLSDKYVKVLFFEDAPSQAGLDSWSSMDKKTKSGTRKFLIIRHLIQKGLLKAGYLILILATQDLKRLVNTVREHAAVVILKSYCRGVEDWIEDDDIINRLIYLADNATRRHRNDIRRVGYTVDRRGKCHQIIAENIHTSRNRNEIEWRKQELNSTYKAHEREMMEYVFNLMVKGKTSNTVLKGFMYDKLEEMESKYYYCEIHRSDFVPIIQKTTALFSDYLERQKQKKTQVNITKDVVNKLHYALIEEEKIPKDRVMRGLYHNIKLEIMRDNQFNPETTTCDAFHRVMEALELLRFNNQELLERQGVTEEYPDITDCPARDRVIGLMTSIKPIWTIKEMDDALVDVSYASIQSAVRNSRITFKNIKPGTGLYCLRNYDPRPDDLQKYQQVKVKFKEAKKEPLMLQMD